MEVLLVIGLVATILGLIANGIRLAKEKPAKDAEAKSKDPIVILEKRLQKQLERKQTLKAASQTNNVTTNYFATGSFLDYNPLEIENK